MAVDPGKEMETDIQIKEMETEMSVSEIMNETVITMDINAEIPVIAREMVKQDVGSVIITSDGKAMGIITERDLVRDIITKDKKPGRVHASKILSSPLVTVKPGTNIIEASKLMLKSDIKRLPVMENGDIVGIVSNTDILVVTPGLSTILKDLIEMNRETLLVSNEEISKDFNSGICELCGYYSEDLETLEGRLLCQSCRDSEGYYD